MTVLLQIMVTGNMAKKNPQNQTRDILWSRSPYRKKFSLRSNFDFFQKSKFFTTKEFFDNHFFTLDSKVQFDEKTQTYISKISLMTV